MFFEDERIVKNPKTWTRIQERKRFGKRSDLAAEQIVNRRVYTRFRFIVKIIFNMRLARGIFTSARPDIDLLAIQAARPGGVENHIFAIGINILSVGGSEIAVVIGAARIMRTGLPRL